jgi:hypothetical protein
MATPLFSVQDWRVIGRFSERDFASGLRTRQRSPRKFNDFETANAHSTRSGDRTCARRTLTGSEIDLVIERAIAAKDMADARSVRADWQAVLKNAADFVAGEME